MTRDCWYLRDADAHVPPFVSRIHHRAALSSPGSYGCYLWTGALGSNGRPIVWRGARPSSAYRVAYEQAGLAIAEGLVLDRECRPGAEICQAGCSPSDPILTTPPPPGVCPGTGPRVTRPDVVLAASWSSLLAPREG